MQLIIYLFIFELFFGFNGKWLVLGGISGRHLLFAVALVAVYGKALWYFVKKRKEKKEQKFFTYFMVELSSFKPFDWFLLLFMALHGIWIIILPFLQRNAYPGAFGYAVSSGLCITMMLLYFPAVYLLRNGQVSWKKYVKFTMGCCVALAMLHPILYVLESIQWKNDHTYYFMERVFIAWEQLVGGHAERQQILMPKYSVRIIYSFSIFIVMSFYFILGKTKKRYLLWALLNILALMTTGTRSHALGVVAGISAFCVLDILLHRWTKAQWKKAVCIAAGTLVFVLALDTIAFKGMNVTRMLASFEVSQEALDKGEPQKLVWEDSEYSAEKEIRGTANSNATRILLIRDLWEKIKERPVLGHGFILPICDMQGLNYIAKVGLLGVALWAVFLGLFLKRGVTMERQLRGSAFPAVFAVTAVLVDAQLQTVFGTFTMAAAVFLFLDLEYKELDIQRRTNEISDICTND